MYPLHCHSYVLFQGATQQAVSRVWEKTAWDPLQVFPDATEVFLRLFSVPDHISEDGSSQTVYCVNVQVHIPFEDCK